jgi:ABC-2 type transport system permease protein
MAVMNFVMLPMFFLSGASFPPKGLPSWLSVVTKFDPLTYAVDPVRRAVFAHVQGSAAVKHTLSAGVKWGGWTLPVGVELCIIALIGVVMLALAVQQFGRGE